MRFILVIILLLNSLSLHAQPKVVAHRGYWDVKGSAQNSIKSLEKAFEIGCYGSEFDVNITSDGVPVVNHDSEINGRRIEQYPFSEFRREVLKNGEALPTLESYLKKGKKMLPMQLILEIKKHLTPETEDRAVDAVIELVNRYNLQSRVEFISFSMHICERLHRLMPQNKVAYLNGDVAPREIIKKGLTGVDYHYNVFLKEHPEWLDEAKEVGCEVNVWTVDKPELLELFAADDRVDIITTNAPELLQDVVAKHPVSLSSRINGLLDESLLMKRSHFGAVVLDATTGFTLYQREPHKLHRPASTLKLFTCATAIHDLGLNHMISTQVSYTGEVVESPQKKRMLKGDLYVIGGMNPILTENELSLLLDQCASLGVDSIAGHVIADLSMKKPARMGAGWCWDDKGDDSPQLSPLLFERDTTFMEAFVIGLHEQKIYPQGTGYGVCPPDAKMLAYNSATLQSLLPLCLKPSDNLIAESILYQLGKQDSIPFAETDVSLAHVRRLLAEVYPDDDCCSIVDGSGLSFYNMVTPLAIVRLLKFVYDSDFYEVFRKSLPVAAEDGTLKNRMKNTPAAHRVFAKTGVITGTVTLAGYAEAANGHTLIFALMNDGVPREGGTAAARDLQDRICLLLCE